MPAEPAVPVGGWDVHMHLVPPAMVRAAEAGHFGMSAGPGTLHVCGHGVPLQRIADASKLVDRLHADGLEGGLISVPPPLFRPDLSNDDRRAYAGMVNDALLEACAAHPAAMRPLAYLPMEDPALALETASALGLEWAGVVVGTDANGLSYADRAYHPLWAHLAAARLPVFVHPSSSHDARLGEFYLANLIGNPVETTIIAAQFAFGGVLEAFPELEVILAHGGGCVAALCGRLQRGKDTQRPGIPDDAPDPMQAVRRFHVDSLVHSPGYLRFVIETVGEDRVLLGSDWPFPMGTPDAEYGLGGLSQATRHKLRHTNVQRLFGSRLRGPGAA